MRGAILVLVMVLGGCVMDTRMPAEPECVEGLPSCGEGEAGPWCVMDGVAVVTPFCDADALHCTQGEPTCDPMDLDL